MLRLHSLYLQSKLTIADPGIAGKLLITDFGGYLSKVYLTKEFAIVEIFAITSFITNLTTFPL